MSLSSVVACSSALIIGAVGEGESKAKNEDDYTVEQAVALYKDLLKGYSEPGFQQKLKELRATLEKTEPEQFSMELQELILTVISVVLPRHGLEGSLKCILQTKEKVKALRIVWEVTMSRKRTAKNLHLLVQKMEA